MNVESDLLMSNVLQLERLSIQERPSSPVYRLIEIHEDPCVLLTLILPRSAASQEEINDLNRPDLSAFCLPPSAFCLPPTAYCFLLSAYCLLLSAFCFPPTAFCLPPSLHSHDVIAAINVQDFAGNAAGHV